MNLKSIKIGNIQTENNLFLAPLAGFSDFAMRDICISFGAGLTFTEMVSCKGLFYNSEATKDLLKPTGLHPEGAQVFGSDPEIMAKELKHPYFEPFDIIDINMGCPARKIITNLEGSALLNDIPLAKEIVSACKEATNKPVTVKMRIGWDSFIGDKVAKALEEAGADALTVHGRTTMQGYSGKASLEYIKKVKDAVKIPVIANGDITGGITATKMLTETGADAIMIGRAAQGRPWIFKEILDYFENTEFKLSHQEKLDIALRHGLTLIQEKGERTATQQMRKHIAWYTHGMRNGAKIRASIMAIKTQEDFIKLIDDLRALDE